MAVTETKAERPTVEVRSIDWVPEDERHGKIWQQGPFWFLGNFQFFTLALGFTGPLVGLSLWWSFVAGGLGILFGTIFMALHATQGPRLGLPQMIQSRAQFGYRGVIVVLFGSLFTFMAFNVVDQLLIAAGLEGIFGWNASVVAIVVTTIGALLAIFGHDWLHKAFRILLYISVPVFLLVTIGIVTGNAGEPAEAPGLGFNFVGFMVMFTVAAGYNITYAPYVSDYSRYLPKDTARGPIIASVFFGAAGSPLWLIPLGAYLASRLGASDALVALRDAGNAFFEPLGTVAAIMSVLALVATMGINAYSAMLSVVTGIDCFKKVEPTRADPRRDDRRPRRGVVFGGVRAVDRCAHGPVELADPDALPTRSVDRDQPGRLLPGPPRRVLDHRHLQARRDLRRVVGARSHHLLRHGRRHAAVHGVAAVGGRDLAVHGVPGHRARRRGLLRDRRTVRCERPLLPARARA